MRDCEMEEGELITLRSLATATAEHISLANISKPTYA